MIYTIIGKIIVGVLAVAIGGCGIGAQNKIPQLTFDKSELKVLSNTGIAIIKHDGVLVEHGSISIRLRCNDTDCTDPKVVYVNPDWCGRQFGHAWEADPDGYQISGMVAVGHISNGRDVIDWRAPCGSPDTDSMWVCKICHLKKHVIRTCTAARWNETIEYEKPRTK